MPKEAHIYLIWSELNCFKYPPFCGSVFCLVASELSFLLFFPSPLCCGSMCSASAGRLCLVGQNNEQMFCLFINRSTSVSHFLLRRFYIQQIGFALHPYMAKGHIHTHTQVCVWMFERARVHHCPVPIFLSSVHTWANNTENNLMKLKLI